MSIDRHFFRMLDIQGSVLFCLVAFVITFAIASRFNARKEHENLQSQITEINSRLLEARDERRNILLGLSTVESMLKVRAAAPEIKSAADNAAQNLLGGSLYYRGIIIDD